MRHSDNSGLVYTPRQHVVFSYKLSKLSSHPPKYHNLKEVYAFEFGKQVQFRRQNETLPRAKFLSVNQQQKSSQKTARDKIFKKHNRAPQASNEGKYQGGRALGTKCSAQGGRALGTKCSAQGGRALGTKCCVLMGSDSAVC